MTVLKMDLAPDDYNTIIRHIVEATRHVCESKVDPTGAMGLIMLSALTMLFAYSDLSREEVFAVADSALAMAKGSFKAVDVDADVPEGTLH